MLINSKTDSEQFIRDTAKILYSNSFNSHIVSALVCSFLVFGLAGSESINSLKLSWWGVMMVIISLRFLDALYWKLKLSHTEFNGVVSTLRFAIGAIATATAWSMYTVMAFDAMDFRELAITLIIVASMAAGATSSLSANQAIATTFSTIMLLPLSIFCVFSNNPDQQVLGYLGFVFTVSIAFSAQRSAIFTRNAIKIKHDNAELLDQMKVEQDAVKEANDNLEEKVKERTRRIYELSNLDPLTNLFNRNAFSEQLHSLLDMSQEENNSLALLFIDLDGFKEINDTIGHNVGDTVLKTTANRIEEVCGNHYNMCRWGGDEFLVALPNSDKELAVEKAKSFIQAVSKPIVQDNQHLTLSATIGIAMFPEHGDNGESLIQLADTAMYHQKNTLKSSVCVFDATMMERMKREQELRDGLFNAIERNQMRLCYQPIVDAKTRKVVAFEALLRWEVDGKMIPPDEFICIAEQYGSIIKIGSWVLYSACQEAAKWEFSELPSVCVNVSVIQLMDDSFVEKVHDALAQANLDPSRLHIEVTESLFAENKNKLKSQLRKLQDMGVLVSIDDFGTGYSSLSQLQNLAVNVVKIDRSFVQNMAEGGKAIIYATMHIMRELNCRVVAEGTEELSQIEALDEMGIDYLQGYYFAKPLPAEEVTKWYEEYNQSISVS